MSFTKNEKRCCHVQLISVYNHGSFSYGFSYLLQPLLLHIPYWYSRKLCVWKYGLFDVDNYFMLLNHNMLITKQTIFLCRQKSITPSFIIFLAHLKKIFRIEEYLAKEKKKLNLHLMKWEKLLQSLSWNNFTLGSLVLIFLFIYLFIYLFTDLIQFYLLYTAVIFFLFFSLF